MSTWKEEIERDLQWREAELSILKQLTLSSEETSAKRKVLLRSLILILYAHFEGFCKFIWEFYLSNIENENISRSRLRDSIICLSIHQEIDLLKKDMSPENMLQFFKTSFPNIMRDNIKLNRKLDAKSNLKAEVLSDNIKRIDLDTSIIDTEQSNINSLVYKRNAIAHGERSLINTIEDYSKYEDSIISIMYNLTEQVTEAIENKKFLL